MFKRGKREEFLEFKGEYLGGHSAFPKKRDVHLLLEPDALVVRELGLKIPYGDIVSVENMTKEKISAARVLLLGIVGALWKKEQLFTVIKYNDKVLKCEQSMVFKLDKVEEAQAAIYARVAAAKSQT